MENKTTSFQYGPKNPLKHYVIVARKLPTKANEKTPIFRMKVFAPNSIVAKSRFWFFLSKLKKLKRSHGELLYITEVTEKDVSTVKNYGIWIRYNSRTAIHNMYREYRDVSLINAIQQMYTEMASKHKAKYFNIHVVKTSVISDEEVKRPNTLQFLEEDLKFPLIREGPRKVDRKFRNVITAVRPKLVEC